MKTLPVLAAVALVASMTACVANQRRPVNDPVSMQPAQIDDIAKMKAAGKVRMAVGVEPTDARAFANPAEGPGFRIVEVDTMQLGQKATYSVFCIITDRAHSCGAPALKSR